MSRELARRLASLEAAYPALRAPRPLTDDDRALLTAVEAMAIALVSGQWVLGDDPHDALHRGIENALYRMDCLTPRRYAFARRFDDALNMSLNGSENVACPIDKRERLLKLRQTAYATELLRAFIGIRDAHPSFRRRPGHMEEFTIIGCDGVERYRWPEHEGADAPTVGWRGQGAPAAAVYWGIAA
jgi:hypothetical protein